MSGKKYSDASERLDRQKFYDPNEALGLVKELASANFDEAVFNLAAFELTDSFCYLGSDGSRFGIWH